MDSFAYWVVAKEPIRTIKTTQVNNLKEINKMQHENPINEEIIDLTATFPQSLKDGEHLVYSSDRINLFAIANEGNITWRAADNHGHPLEVTTEKDVARNKCKVCTKLNNRGLCIAYVPCWTLFN